MSEDMQSPDEAAIVTIDEATEAMTKADKPELTALQKKRELQAADNMAKAVAVEANDALRREAIEGLANADKIPDGMRDYLIAHCRLVRDAKVACNAWLTAGYWDSGSGMAWGEKPPE